MTRETTQASETETNKTPPTMRRGAVFAMSIGLLAYFLFTLSDTGVKWLMQNGYSSAQVIFSNGFFGLTCILVFYRIMCGQHVRLITKNIKWNLLRAFLLCIGAFAVTFSLREIELAEFYAVIFTEPFFITAMSAFFFGDRVGLKRWIAILAGFIGVLVMANPGNGPINVGMVYALIAALSFSLSLSIVRHMGPDESPATLAVFAMVSTGLFALPLMLDDFTLPAMHHWPIFILTGIFVGTAIISMVAAFQHAPSAAIVTPFHYTQIVLGALFGHFIFGEQPDIRVYIGATIIISCGLYIFVQEYKADKRHKSYRGNSPQTTPTFS